MVKKYRIILFLSVLLFAVGQFAYSQTFVTVNENVSPEELVNQLFDTGCVEISNVTSSSPLAVGQFQGNASPFPLSSGVIIRSGRASYSQGPYTGENLSSQLNDNTDPDLEAINANITGQDPYITDVGFLQFDFMPLSNKFTFNFLFASNEYGEYQCLSSDTFAFILTNLTTGESTNLAVLPNTEIPVSVKSIRDNAFNTACSSAHPDLFENYIVDSPNSTINMRGYTTVLQASSHLIPGDEYRIRLMIGDSYDATYDSAIFLEEGSFETSLDLGGDREICEGNTVIIDSDLDPSEYDFVWRKDGNVLPAETGPSIETGETGTYSLQVTKIGNNCKFSDEVVVSDLEVNTPKDIYACHSDNGQQQFDLTENDAAGLGLPGDYKVFYYASQADLDAGQPIPENEVGNYTSTSPHTIYVKLFNTSSSSFCDAQYSFNLIINDPIDGNSSYILYLCEDHGGYTTNLNAITPQLLNGQNPNDFNFKFYGNELDAQNGENAIQNPSSYELNHGFSSRTIWVRIVFANNSDCYAVVNFTIEEVPLPLVDSMDNVEVCSQYVLPPLAHGSYYTQPDGQGQELQAGDIVDEMSTIYIFNGPNYGGCTAQTQFRVFVADKYDIAEEHCGEFIVPSLPVGSFYTEAGGPNGNGQLIPGGAILTTDQTIYYYAKIDGVFCRDQAFVIDILSLPPADDPDDVVTCGSYTLPPLSNGSYYTQPDGGGTQLFPGDVITESQDVHVYNTNANCILDNVFHISIISEPEDVVACGSYTLPALDGGGYFTQPVGGGTHIPDSTEITTSQTIYIYAPDTYDADCTNNFSFDVEIKPVPPVDNLPDQEFCEGETYELPHLTDGDYFTEPDRNGDKLYAGKLIDSTQTIYINSTLNGCSNETQFHIQVDPLPPLVTFNNIFRCEPYVLPVPDYGKYYTQPNAQGEQLHPGDTIFTTQTIYLRNTAPGTPCVNEAAFKVTVYDVSLPDIPDVHACDSYTLPPLDKGNYYTAPDGLGTKLPVGHVIDSSQTIHVFIARGGRFSCDNNLDFDVIISETPVLPSFEDRESCGSYTLPDLPDVDYDIGYYTQPGGEGKIDPDDYTITKLGINKIYVYGFAADNRDCFDQEEFDLTIYPLLDLDIADGVVCRDPETGEVLSPTTLHSGLDPDEFTVNWFKNGSQVHTGPDFTTSDPGDYTVKTIKLDPEVGPECNYAPTTVVVRESGPPIANAVVTSDDFSDHPVVEVKVTEGYGNYIFQLDDGPFQSSPVFKDVPSGSHTIVVKGKLNTCGEVVLEVEVLQYPKFFTPNNDGKNDTWSIPSLRNHNATIYIHDRFGRLLAVISGDGPGWNGTYNGKNMPSDDYWFKAKYQRDGKPRTFVSHFTLKR